MREDQTVTLEDGTQAQLTYEGQTDHWTLRVSSRGRVLTQQLSACPVEPIESPKFFIDYIAMALLYMQAQEDPELARLIQQLMAITKLKR